MFFDYCQPFILKAASQYGNHKLMYYFKTQEYKYSIC
jgi:hypothetical protein